MYQSVSDPTLCSFPSNTSNPNNNLNSDLSISQHTLDQSSDMGGRLEDQTSDIPLLFQLVAVGLAGTVRGGGKVEHGGKRGRKLGLLGLSKIHTLKHKEQIKSSSSPSLPEMYKVCVCMYVCMYVFFLFLFYIKRVLAKGKKLSIKKKSCCMCVCVL